jgi:hypothetical protein
MLVNVKEPLYSKVKKRVRQNPVEYNTIQQFVNLAVKEKLKRDEAYD